MYNPYENENNSTYPEMQSSDPHTEPEQPTATPYTAQTGETTPAASSAEPQAPKASEPTYSAEPGETVERSVVDPNVTYHTGPIHSGSYVPPQTNTQYTGYTSPYTGSYQGQGYQPQQNNQQPAQRSAYTWTPQNPGGVPQYHPGSYYNQPKPAKVKKPRKKGSAKFAVKLLAAVLACAVVSLGSVGVFAAMIQNGVVNIESTGSENTTAAFTIYKQADSSTTSTTTVTGESMTAQEVAQKLIPSVVCIQNYQITQQSSYFFGYSDDSDSDSLSPTGEGSGIIISKDGYIVTNQHVIDGATSLKVVTSEGLTYEAELIGEDTQTDLAVIKITTDDELTPAEFGSSDDLQVADEVMAIGNPGGLQLNSSVTFGRVSALNREITNSDTGYTMKCIQTDAAINPGNSGGALVDMNGHVVGINSSKIVATGYEGLGFAIPSDTVQPIVSDLIEYGYVKDRPMLGISGQYIDRLTASFYGMNAGYYVAQVNSENAAASGLKKGDMITAIDDTQVTSSTTISNYIVNKKPGDTVTLTVDRMSTGESGVTIELVLSENTGSSTSDALGN